MPSKRNLLLEHQATRRPEPLQDKWIICAVCIQYFLLHQDKLLGQTQPLKKKAGYSNPPGPLLSIYFKPSQYSITMIIKYFFKNPHHGRILKF